MTKEELCGGLSSAMLMWERIDKIVSWLNPDLDDEEHYEATRRMMELALQIEKENQGVLQ